MQVYVGTQANLKTKKKLVFHINTYSIPRQTFHTCNMQINYQENQKIDFSKLPAIVFEKTSHHSLEPSSEDPDTKQFSSPFFSIFLFFLFPLNGPIRANESKPP